MAKGAERMFGLTVRSAALLAALPCAALTGGVHAQSEATSSASPILKREFIYESAAFPQAHASTLAQSADGTVVAAWFGGTGEGNPDVSIYVSRLVGGKWSEPARVADGTRPGQPRLPTWNPVLFAPPGGDLILFYKVGPNPHGWWGMVSRSKDSGRSWSKGEALPEGILGPIKNKPVVLEDGRWLAPTSDEPEPKVWNVHFDVSADQGRTWQRTADVPSPEGLQAIQPSVLFHKDGTLEAVARTRQGVLAMTWSKDGGRTWSGMAATDVPNPNSGTDAITLRDGRQLLVYNHTGHQPDTPGNGLRYPINLALSDDGISWRKVATLESEPMPDGYAYPSLIQTSDGLVHITYTWNRRRIRHVLIDPARL